MMFMYFEASTYGFAALISLLLLIVSQRWQTWLAAALLMTTIGFGTVSLHSLTTTPLSVIHWYAIEALVHSCWLMYLLSLQHLQVSKYNNQGFYLVTLTLAAVLILALLSDTAIVTTTELLHSLMISLLLLQCIYASLLIENIARNLLRFAQWHCKLLIVGVFLLFVFNSIFYTFTLLLKGSYSALWLIKPIITIAATALVCLALSRNAYQAITTYSSSHPKSYNSSLIVSGLFLLITAGAGQISLVFTASDAYFLQLMMIGCITLTSVALFFSRQLRSFLREHVLAQKYNYRQLWHEFNQLLYHPSDHRNSYTRACLAITSLFDVKQAQLWYRDSSLEWHCHQQHNNHCAAHEEASAIASSTLTPIEILQALIGNDNVYIFPHTANEKRWLIARLHNNGQTHGLLLLEKPRLTSRFDREDLELLQQACEQANFYLQQHLADAELTELHLFDTYHQATAYVVHDMKTLQSQFTLLSSNAEKHRDNPAFIDDVLKTIDHAGRKVTTLLQRIDNQTQQPPQMFDVAATLRKAVKLRACTQPIPHCDCQLHCLSRGNADELETVFVNLIKNAQEACHSEASIEVSLLQQQHHIQIQIQDNGIGMSEDYIANKLFKPFNSTKGVNGMGIGVYQCQKIIRAMAGKLRVSSEPGHGTTFTILLPLFRNVNDDEKQDHYETTAHC